MPGATTNGVPYAVTGDPIGDYPATSQDLADKLDPTFTGVTYSGSWSDYGASGYEEVSYAKVGSVVHLRGSAKHGTAGQLGTVFTLPAGYRPAKTRRYMVNANTGFALVTIANTGVVAIAAYISSGTAAIVAFDGVTFDLGA